MTARDWGLAAAAIALILDQGSKLLLLYGFGFAGLMPGDHVFSSPVFDLTMAWNSGISFSFLSMSGRAGALVLVAAALVVVGALGVWLWRTTRLLLAVGLGLVIGGALGNNLVDRLVYGRVADFFDLHLGKWHFFVCNLADVAISLGVILIIVDAVWEGWRSSSPTLAQGGR
jgi:signal peptidase II